MSQNRKFRLKRTHDMELIDYLHKLIFPSDELYKTENKAYYWIVYDQDLKIPAGFCIGTDIGDNTMFLARAGLLDFACGNGLHKRMMRVLEKLARKIGIKTILTYTVLSNIRSSHNLQKYKYMLYAPEYNYVGNNCLYWRKEL